VRYIQQAIKALTDEHPSYAGAMCWRPRLGSGKTLSDHRADRKAWLMAMLGRVRARSPMPGHRCSPARAVCLVCLAPYQSAQLAVLFGGARLRREESDRRDEVVDLGR
jgi:hypothetical protein